ncbi:KR domain-containing protein [Streptomyces sp. M19]
MARWAVERGAEHVVLLSRSGPDAEGVETSRADVERLGARVTVVACDVADRDALSDVVESVRDTLRMVVHAAGVRQALTDLDTVTADRVTAELRVKATGAAHLDELTRDLELDAFVLFSSGTATWGSAGQVGCAAADAALDALAAHRRARGQTALSVAWGPGPRRA